MAFDFSQISDEQLEASLQSMMDMPSAHDLEIRKATVAEYNRRMAARNAPKPAAPPANVQANLDAAATPITPEPVAGPARPVARPAPSDPDVRTLASMTDEEMLAPVTADSFRPTKAGLPAYGERYQQAVANTIDARVAAKMAARAEGYEDPEQLAYNAAHGVLPEDYVAAGRPMPTALRPAAPAAPEPVSEEDPDYWQRRYQQEVLGPPQAEPADSVGRVDAYFSDKAKRSESGHLLPQYQKPTFDEFVADQSQQQVRANARKDMETYGFGNDINAKQQAARDERRRGEDTVRGNRIDSIINRLASQTGTPRAEIRARLESLQKPGDDGKRAIDLDDGLSPQEVAMLGQPFTDTARDARDREVAEDRAFNKRRGRMAGSNLRANAANNFNDMPADWQNFVRAGGKGATPLDRDADGAKNAMRFINAEALSGNDPIRRQLAEQQAEMQLRQNAPDIQGAQDLASGKSTPESSQHVDRLALDMDVDLGGFSWEAEDALAQKLRDPPYNMPQAEAEAEANRAANKRRWLWNQGRRPRKDAAPAAPAGPGGLPSPAGATPYRYGA